jgi:hypothetical protein
MDWILIYWTMIIMMIWIAIAIAIATTQNQRASAFKSVFEGLVEQVGLK